MPTVDFVTCCMGRLDHLKQTLPALLSQPDATVTVVDYSCPNSCGDWVELHHPRARVVRIPGRVRWSHPEALNAGAREGSAPWLAFIDCDIFLDPTFVSFVSTRLAPGQFYRFAPVYDGGVVGSNICPRAAFAQIGGYDEAFCEYGDHDLDLYDRLAAAGVDCQPLPSSLVHHIWHDDASRTARFQEKDLRTAMAVSRTYRFLKRDVGRLTGVAPPLTERKAMFEAARRAVALAGGQPAKLAYRYTADQLDNGMILDRAVLFQVRFPKKTPRDASGSFGESSADTSVSPPTGLG